MLRIFGIIILSSWVLMPGACSSCDDKEIQVESKSSDEVFTLCEEPGNLKKETSDFRITFVGDLLLDRGVREYIEHHGIESLFHSSVDSVFSRSQIVVANLECPVTNIKEPINKRFIFRAEPVWLGMLRKHGVTHLNLANNHSMDQGRDGLIDTEKNIVKNGMTPLGFGKNSKEACSSTLLSSNSRDVYLLSSLRVPSENWVYLENKPCVCEMVYDEINEKIRNIKLKDPSALVLVQLHWGIEHVPVPNVSQKQAAYSMIDAGADAIIGHHPHVVQTVENYKEKPIFYSIGNFIFDQSKPINSKGMMVQLKITDSTVVVDTIPFVIEKCVPKVR